jgi:hypothetical protein
MFLNFVKSLNIIKNYKEYEGYTKVRTSKYLEKLLKTE